MRPGLLPPRLSLSATSSTSRATHRGAFSKPFNERIHADDTSSGPSLNLPQYGAISALRVSHIPASAQAMRIHQSRLNPVAEVAKVGMCADPCIAMGRTLDCGSSGSDHEPSSVCLSAMVNEFIESESVSSSARAGSVDFSKTAMSNGLAPIPKSLQNLALCRDNQEINLLRDVQAILDAGERKPGSVCTDRTKSMSPSRCLKRLVMSGLQKMGYNAAICKTRWDHSGALQGGDYEYIDVLFASDVSMEPSRLLVDIEFQAQFEIARPSSEFSVALSLVPPVFVGRPERLQQIVHLMAEAMMQSLCLKGLHLPPWRKLNYMKAKWFSSYKRTSNNGGRGSCKQYDDFVNNRGFAGIAVGGYGLDPSGVNEIEHLCYGPKHQIRHGKHTTSSSKVRDDSITVTTTDWQPPPLEARLHSNTRSQSNVTGLSSMLPHLGPPAHGDNVIAKAA